MKKIKNPEAISIRPAAGEKKKCLYNNFLVDGLCLATAGTWNSLRNTHWNRREWNINSPWLDRFFFFFFRKNKKKCQVSQLKSGVLGAHSDAYEPCDLPSQPCAPARFSFESPVLCPSGSAARVGPVNSKELLFAADHFSFLTMTQVFQRRRALHGNTGEHNAFRSIHRNHFACWMMSVYVRDVDGCRGSS